MKQIMKNYSPTDQLVWKTLFERQRLNLETKGSKIYNNCLAAMKPVINANSVPSFDAINEWFKTSTGWEIVVVAGLIPVEDFFDLLANKQFCSSTWLRTMEQLDYLEEPDMFHDTFGHIPLLADPTFSDFAHRFGQLGQSFKGDTLVLNQMQRLYWFTIEFGLIQEQGLGKVYGAGIISSFGETNRVAAKNCNILPFDINVVLKKVFQNDVLQEDYFLIQSLEELNDALLQASVKLARKIVY
jgi:phenylalanine-4-hydroxylase